jgi:hypothetical protein
MAGLTVNLRAIVAVMLQLIVLESGTACWLTHPVVLTIFAATASSRRQPLRFQSLQYLTGAKGVNVSMPRRC